MSQSRPTIGQERIDDVLEEMEDEATNVAENVVEAYGEPDGVTEHRLVWYDTGPWKRTEVHREGVHHEFPDQHTDFVEQFVDYHVPPERRRDRHLRRQRDDQADPRRALRGVSRRARELPGDQPRTRHPAGRQDGRRGTRGIHGDLREEGGGDEPDYITDLQFEPSSGDQRDPDEQTLTEKHEQQPQEHVQNN